MSSSKDSSDPAILATENHWQPKHLVKSRWAPGGLEDKIASTDGSAFGAKALIAASARMCAEPADIVQTGIDKMMNDIEANKKARNLDNKKKNKEKNKRTKKNKRNMLKNLRQGKVKHEKHLPTTTAPTQEPHRIIGPLSEEEKKVQVENPMFDPTKHKGLGSSRWAEE